MQVILQKVCVGIASTYLFITPATWSAERSLCLGMGFQRTSRLLEVNGKSWTRRLLSPWVEGRLQWGPAVNIRFAFVNGGYAGRYDDNGDLKEESREYSGIAWGLEWVVPNGGDLGNLSLAAESTEGHNSIVSGGGPMQFYRTSQSDIMAGYRRHSRNGAISVRAALLISYFLMEQGTSIFAPFLELNQVAPGVSLEGIALPFKPSFICGQIGWTAGLNASFSGGIRFR